METIKQTKLFLVQDTRRKLTLVEVVDDKINVVLECNSPYHASQIAKLSRASDNSLEIYTNIPVEYSEILSDYTTPHYMSAASFLVGLDSNN